MRSLEKIKDMLMEELDKCSRRDELTNSSLETIDKLTHAVKSIDTIMAMEEAGYSNDGYSYARGRRGNVRRDSMGRYSRNSYGNMSYDNSYRGGNMPYSRDDAKHDLVDQLRDISMNADGEHRQMIEDWIRQVESR